MMMLFYKIFINSTIIWLSYFHLPIYHILFLLTIISTTPMKNFPRESKPASPKECQRRLNRANTMPTADNINLTDETKMVPNILTFQEQTYPFLNSQKSSFFMFKTVVNVSLSNNKLERIINLCHPNIIGLTKIVRSSGKQGCPTKSQIYYSFYYETIQYGLKTISEDTQNTAKFSSIILALDLIKVVSEVIEYLQEWGIYYAVRKEDIGMDRQGSVKIYIPPHTLFNSDDDTQSTQEAFADVADWWMSVQDNCHRQMFRKDSKIKLSENLKNARIAESFIYNEHKETTADNRHQQIVRTGSSRQKMNTSRNTQQLAKNGELRLEKINKIERDAKLLRERIIEKAKQPENNAIHKSNPVLPAQRQTQTLPKEIIPRQNPTQQTPNYITIPKTALKLPNRPNQSPHLFDSNNDPAFTGYHDESGSEGIEDMQFGPQYESTTTATKNVFRNTLNLGKESSNCAIKTSRQLSGITLRQKQNKNQLVYHRKLTESAGPLQLQCIINQSESQDKQSNIYEVTCEDDNDSAKIKQTDQTNLIFGDRSTFVPAGQQIDIKLKTMTRSNDFLSNSPTLNNERMKVIEQKIKKVLQKTKDAIVLLNGVKHKRGQQINSLTPKNDKVYF